MTIQGLPEQVTPHDALHGRQQRELQELLGRHAVEWEHLRGNVQGPPGGRRDLPFSGELPSPGVWSGARPSPCLESGIPLPDPGSAHGLRAPSAMASKPATTFATPLAHTECQKELQIQQVSQLPLQAQFQLVRSRQIQLELPSSTPPGLSWQATRPAAAIDPSAHSAYSPSRVSQQQAGTPEPAHVERVNPSGGRKDDRSPQRDREACGLPQVCSHFLMTCLSHR